MELSIDDLEKTDQLEEAVSLDNVTLYYQSNDKPSIGDINLNIKKGEFIVLMGESGCGKTTVTRIINGLATKFYEGHMDGKATVLDKEIGEYDLWQIGQYVGSIFQDPKSQFFASITEDEVAFGCENYGVKYEDLKARVFEAIKSINGENLIGKEIFPMSSGEKQKIAIASVNSVNPLIYIFDEPSANLDMNSVESLKKLMKNLKDAGHTVIVSEHRLYYLTDLGDRFIYLKDGQINREMTSYEFKNINEVERKRLGIRCNDLKNIVFNVPEIKFNNLEALVVENLSFYYKKGNYIFEDLSFKAYKGDVIAICGHNGAGKTTLSKILCGIEKEKKGEVFFYGKKVNNKKRKNKAYFVMQNIDCTLFGDSVKNEIRLNKKNANDNYINEILDKYNLRLYKEKHPSTLSGGQKQRLSLAVSDAVDADILILDEPTSGLDYKNMCGISNHIRELSEQGKTILIITHDYEFAAMTCNKALHFICAEKSEMFEVDKNRKKLFDCFMDK